MVSVETFEIRVISPNDKQGLVDGFERLSEESRYRRFLAPRGRLSDAELRYFSEVDHHDHEALVAVNPQSGQGVGVARYVRDKHNPSVAELAVAVVDDWQGQGIGSRLTAALADRARAEGIRSFSALVLADNRRALNVLDELGPTRVVHSEPGKVEVLLPCPSAVSDACHASCAPSREKTSKRLLTAIDRAADRPIGRVMPGCARPAREQVADMAAGDRAAALQRAEDCAGGRRARGSSGGRASARVARWSARRPRRCGTCRPHHCLQLDVGQLERQGPPAAPQHICQALYGADAGLGATVWEIGLSVRLSLLSSKEQILALLW